MRGRRDDRSTGNPFEHLHGAGTCDPPSCPACRWDATTRRAMEDVILQVTLHTDGRVAVWLREPATGAELAAALRVIADGFDGDPRRVG